LAQQNFDGLHVCDKPGLSGYLVCLVHLVSRFQPNKPDRPNRPNEQDKLADFFSILLEKHEGREKLTATPALNASQTGRYLFGCGV
jgi:hypothetical protein